MIEEIFEKLQGQHPAIEDKINAIADAAIGYADKWLPEVDELLEDDVDSNIDNFFEKYYREEADMKFISEFRDAIIAVVTDKLMGTDSD